MSYSPNSELLRRTIDFNYADKKRASSLKWISVNAVVFLLFSFDLWGKCEGYTSPLHYVELCCAGVAAANLLTHAVRLARRPAPAPSRKDPRTIDTSRLESSFASAVDSAEESAAEALSLSLSGAGRAWRTSASPSPSPPHSRHSPHSPHSPHHSPQVSHSPPSPLSRYDRDEFIADQQSLTEYLRQRTVRGRAEGAEAARGTWPAAAPVYQLAALETEKSGSGEEGGAAASPQLWRRLQLDPQRLTQFNLNLRLWMHVTILERVVREMDALDDVFAQHGLSDVRIGQVNTERLRKMAASGFPALGSLLPFLEPFPDQRYVVQRYRELAHGGCLSEYKWNGGGSDWDESRPTDAELVLAAFAAYMDAQLPGGGFSGTLVCSAPAPPPPGRAALAVRRLSRLPPHYVLVRGDETVEVGAGRNNLLHCLLLLLATCAARDPPALQRLHLGPAGLNMLWIVGR